MKTTRFTDKKSGTRVFDCGQARAIVYKCGDRYFVRTGVPQPHLLQPLGDFDPEVFNRLSVAIAYSIAFVEHNT